MGLSVEVTDPEGVVAWVGVLYESEDCVVLEADLNRRWRVLGYSGTTVYLHPPEGEAGETAKVTFRGLPDESLTFAEVSRYTLLACVVKNRGVFTVLVRGEREMTDEELLTPAPGGDEDGVTSGPPPRKARKRVSKKRFPKTEEAMTSGLPGREDAPASKIEAVKVLMDEGINSPTAVSQEARQRFDMDISPNTVSNYKSEIRGKSSPAGKKAPSPQRAGARITQGVEEFLSLMTSLKDLVERHGKENVLRVLEKL